MICILLQLKPAADPDSDTQVSGLDSPYRAVPLALAPMCNVTYVLWKEPSRDIKPHFCTSSHEDVQTAGSYIPFAAEVSQYLLREGTLWIRGREIKGMEDAWEVCVGRSLSSPVVIKRL